MALSMLNFDTKNPASESLFSSFNVIDPYVGPNSYGGIDSVTGDSISEDLWLQKEFNLNNCTYVLSLLTSFPTPDGIGICLLHWVNGTMPPNEGEKLNPKQVQSVEVDAWLVDNLPTSGKLSGCSRDIPTHPKPDGPWPHGIGWRIEFRGNRQLYNSVLSQDFQGYVEALCNHLSSL